MSYNFLRDYTIPTTTATAAQQQPENYENWEQQKIDSICYNYYDGSTTAAGSVEPQQNAVLNYNGSSYESVGYGVPQTTEENYAQEQYQNPSRFVAPGKQQQGFKNRGAHQPVWRKRKFSTGPGAVTGSNGNGATSSKAIEETTTDGKLVIFQGRDESFPEELNKLIHPLACELCKTNMNSMLSAKDHYDSKVHNRNLTSWLTKNYAEKGLEPPAIKRPSKEGPIGPDAFHCETCDLKLTSLTHANQHYAGRRHRLVASNISKPSGAGFYNSEGKWVRTATKLTPQADADGRFGIGEPFKYSADCSSDTPDTTTTNGVKQTETASAQIALNNRPDLCCKLCNISVTSASQLQMHISGTKHIKRLTQRNTSGAIAVGSSETAEATATAVNNTKVTEAVSASNVAASPTIEATSILASLNDKPLEPTSDLSMYRTPSGSYYCKTCNTTMCNVTALSQHLVGKRHIKKSAEEKAKELVSMNAAAAGVISVNAVS